jgi:hypothetical protein
MGLLQSNSTHKFSHKGRTIQLALVSSVATFPEHNNDTRFHKRIQVNRRPECESHTIGIIRMNIKSRRSYIEYIFIPMSHTYIEHTKNYMGKDVRPEEAWPDRVPIFART